LLKKGKLDRCPFFRLAFDATKGVPKLGDLFKLFVDQRAAFWRYVKRAAEGNILKDFRDV
jgi:hypothetical protein